MRQIFLAKLGSLNTDAQRADYWNTLVVKCLRCGKSSPFRLRGKPNVEHRLFEKAKDASDYCRSENFKKAGIQLSP